MIFQKYGYDFRDYSSAHVRRRISNILNKYEYSHISQLKRSILENKQVFDDFLNDFSINVTEMFRDPGFFKAIRERVVPVLRSYPYINIWHAGCASGEEVYSMAILLYEEGLFDKCLLYATDFNKNILIKAAKGKYLNRQVQLHINNYNEAGGTKSFSDYYRTEDDNIILDNKIKRNIIFSEHDLTRDGSFGDMHLIICRNVLIYFNKQMQEKVIRLFHKNLIPNGYLCLGTKESLIMSPLKDSFELENIKQKIYIKSENRKNER
jgi:chemotaxis protein methyltransferase CheR